MRSSGLESIDYQEYFTKPSLSFIANGAVAQLEERLNRTQEVGGSNPLGSTIVFP